MTFITRFNANDWAWVMFNNEPTQLKVGLIIAKQYEDDETSWIKYKMTRPGQSNSEEFDEKDVFKTKQELLRSFLDEGEEL